MSEHVAMPERLRRAEQALAEAEQLLRRRQAEIDGQQQVEFDGRLLQGVRELAAMVREMAAQGQQVSSVSAEHAAELDETAAQLTRADAETAQRGGHP